MRIAICDDSSDQVEKIKSEVQTFLSSKKDIEAEIFTFDKSFDFLGSQEKQPFDIALLDICMPGILGTDVAREIRKRKDKTEIIFLTTSEDFAIEAFSLKAIHYLLKPYTYKEFEEAMSRALTKIGESAKKTITLTCVNGVNTISISDIEYIECFSHNLVIYLKEESIEVRKTLSALYDELNKLSPNQFAIIAKGFIVNFKQVKILNKNGITLSSGKELPVSDRLFSTVKEAYFDYRFEEENNG